MALWRRQERSTKLHKLSTHDLIEWMDTSVMHLGRTLDMWRFKQSPSEQVSDQLEQVNLIWSELSSRKVV